MVGVPGRSKGCQTCVKRRVKCDEGRPFCERCIKIGYKCQGYEKKLEIREHTFVKFGNEHRSQVSKPRSRTPENESVVFVLNPASREPSDPAATVPASLSLIAFKDDMQFSFVFDNSVWRTYGWPWLEMSAHGKLGNLSLDACRCFAQTVFGKQYHQKDIELQGLVLYGATVRNLSQRLNDVPTGCGAEELITPILVLLMYASATGDRNASGFHVQGLLRIMHYCQPATLARMPFRLAFESARSTLFTVSLVLKQRCILEQPMWKSEPWAGAPKSPQNQLIDILVNLPGYLQDLAQIERGTKSQASLVACLEADLKVLSRWHREWHRHNPNAAWEVDPFNLPAGTAPCIFRVFPKVLWFRSFTQSTEILLYNAVLICILGVLYHVSLPDYVDHSPPTSRNPLRLPEQRKSVFTAALEICRAFEYQLINLSASREASYFWLLPLGVASKILHRKAAYKCWIDEMLDMSKDLKSHGSASSEFAFGYWGFLDEALAYEENT